MVTTSNKRFRVKALLWITILAFIGLAAEGFVVTGPKGQIRTTNPRGGIAPLHSTVLVEAKPTTATKSGPKGNNKRKKKNDVVSQKKRRRYNGKKQPSNKKNGSQTKRKKRTSNPKAKRSSSEPKGSRTERNSQYMKRQWKAQQMKEKKRKEAKTTEPGSGLVSAVGLKTGSANNKKVGPKKSNQKKSRRRSADRKKSSPSKSTNNMLSWMDLSPGSSISGKVIKVLPYGALVRTPYDIPGRTHGCAMLHISQISNEKIEDLSKFVQVGQQIEEARVVSLNRDEGRVAISLRNSTKRAIPMETLSVGDEVEGKVVRMKQYGAFVDVGCKRNALLHISRMSLYKVSNMSDFVNIGDTVKVRVLRVDSEGKNIAVSMLTPENDKFVDRRDLQKKRMNIWQKIVSSTSDDDDDDDEDIDEAKRELLELDKVIWDDFFDSLNTPRSVEV